MSSGFVSGGTVDNPVERDDEWRQAQAELEAARKAKADLAAQHNGKSLFEILQENKDKKQAEFEEKARYKLHVSLDDDEANYLLEIEEKKRREEASVRKDTYEQLDAFKRQQEEAERKAREEENEDTSQDVNTQWAAPGRKRKKGPETSLLKGVKLRKSNSVPEDTKGGGKMSQGKGEKPIETAQSASSTTNIRTSAASNTVKPSIIAKKPEPQLSIAKSTNAVSLGLGYASSDED